MSFVGPVNRLGDVVRAPARPRAAKRAERDRRRPGRSSGSSTSASRCASSSCSRTAATCWAQVTREEAEELELAPGSKVFVRPRRTRVFETSASEREEGQLARQLERATDGSQSRRQVVGESAPALGA